MGEYEGEAAWTTFVGEVDGEVFGSVVVYFAESSPMWLIERFGLGAKLNAGSGGVFLYAAIGDAGSGVSVRVWIATTPWEPLDVTKGERWVVATRIGGVVAESPCGFVRGGLW